MELLLASLLLIIATISLTGGDRTFTEKLNKNVSTNLISELVKAPNVYLETDNVQFNLTYLWEQTQNRKRRRRVANFMPVASTVSTTRYTTPGRKEGSAGAPLLNYIFDVYLQNHQHRSERLNRDGGIYPVSTDTVESLYGSNAQFDCKVDILQDKVVSWVKRKTDGTMDLLTIGTQKYTSDSRYASEFVVPNIWRLTLNGVVHNDAGEYDCQLSAHPPRVARLHLVVPDVFIAIVDGAGGILTEQVCVLDSTVALRCEVKGLDMSRRALHWFRKEQLLNDDVIRGGVSVVVNLSTDGGDSILRVARVTVADNGYYECRVVPSPDGNITTSAKALLHVIQGESLAELHQGSRSSSIYNTIVHKIIITILLFNFLCHLFY